MAGIKKKPTKKSTLQATNGAKANNKYSNHVQVPSRLSYAPSKHSLSKIKSRIKKIYIKKSNNVCIVFVNRKDISTKCIFAAVSSLFLARFFILLLTRASVCSLLLSSTLDWGLFQVNGDTAGLTARGQPAQDGTTDTPFSASLRPLCILLLLTFHKTSP